MELSLRLLVVVLSLDLLSAAKLGVVQTEGGAVEGRSHGMGLFNSVDVFKGIPFADVPKRWEKPQLHPGWTGVLKAIKYRDRCLQVNLLQTKIQGSEDCLYLNIFVPQGRKLSQNLPVMVYLFGGAFLLGASNDVELLGASLYDGKELSHRGSVLVVTVNYRVGPLGFLSSGDSRLPGNYGLWDQHTAISWVKRNIEKFGGNPDNITIFGQSAGAASVSYQMLSPYSKGLFRRAITQGGVALSPWAQQRKPLSLLKKIASKAGCWRTDVDEMIQCLKMTDPAGVTMAGKIDILLLLGKGVVMDLLELAPVVDGDFVPDEPSKLFSNAAQFDYMAGLNSFDGHIFAGVDVPSINERKANTTLEQVRGVLAGLTKDRSGSVVDQALDLYSWTWGVPPDLANIKKTIADIETDFLFLVPTQISLKLHAQHSSGARTFSYLFSMKTRIPGLPAWVEAEHGEDLQYLFGKPYSLPLLYLPRDRDLAAYMIQYWSNFARTGDPNTGQSRVPVPWPSFTRTHQPFLCLSHKMDKSSVSYDLRADYVSFWTSTYRNQTAKVQTKPGLNQD